VGDVDFTKLGDFSVLFAGISPGFGMRLVDERSGEEVHRRIASEATWVHGYYQPAVGFLAGDDDEVV